MTSCLVSCTPDSKCSGKDFTRKSFATRICYKNSALKEKKSKRKVQGVPQSQATAVPRHQVVQTPFQKGGKTRVDIFLLKVYYFLLILFLLITFIYGNWIHFADFLPSYYFLFAFQH